MEYISIQNLKELIRQQNASLAVGVGQDIHLCFGRGVSDLYRLYTTMPALLYGASAVDKVVGKGAAALMILAHLKEVHAFVISRSALSLFAKSDVHVTYTQQVDNIINRRGDDICPVERLCTDVDTPEECLPLIKSFLQSIAP